MFDAGQVDIAIRLKKEYKNIVYTAYWDRRASVPDKEVITCDDIEVTNQKEVISMIKTLFPFAGVYRSDYGSKKITILSLSFETMMIVHEIYKVIIETIVVESKKRSKNNTAIIKTFTDGKNSYIAKKVSKKTLQWRDVIELKSRFSELDYYRIVSSC